SAPDPFRARNPLALAQPVQRLELIGRKVYDGPHERHHITSSDDTKLTSSRARFNPLRSGSSPDSGAARDSASDCRPAPAPDCSAGPESAMDSAGVWGLAVVSGPSRF